MYRSTNRAQRILAALAAAALVGMIGMVLLLGLAVRNATRPMTGLIAVMLDPPPEAKPQPQPPSRQNTRQPGRNASPANLRNRASPIVAAPNPLPLPPVSAATAPADGAASQSGAAEQAGPGQGAGGTGSGAGDGNGGGLASEPVQLRGRLSVDDFPFGLIGPGERASVRLRYVVQTDGSVSQCETLRSSGFAEVDAMACRLIEQRFRYRPARNANGIPIAASVVETHTWFRRS